MKNHYEDSDILFLESGDHSKPLQICIDFALTFVLTFLPFMVDLTLVRTSIYGKSNGRKIVI